MFGFVILRLGLGLHGLNLIRLHRRLTLLRIISRVGRGPTCATRYLENSVILCRQLSDKYVYDLLERVLCGSLDRNC